VRKGSSYTKNSYLNVCSGTYFSRAMDLIEDKIKDPVFYVFSNDFNWCKDNLELNKHKYVIVNANDSQHAVDELYLMKNCKNFILSNSTMGWWAQYLNASDEKIVVTPNIWTKGKIELLNDLIEDEWIKVEV
jgi:hypothetical protein